MASKPEPISLDDLPDRVDFIRSELKDEYLQPHSTPWIVGFSGGKDSTLLLQFVFEMLLSLAPDDRRREVHVVANDTLVESPFVSRHLDRVLGQVESSIPTLRVPVTVAKTTPAIDQTFWVNLIGRGYPSPNRSFRWCTDRMKIQPTSAYIKSQVAENGKVILLLGVRRTESARRATTYNRYSNGERLNAHGDLHGCMVFRPIVELSTEEVWMLLMQLKAPWGGSHKELVTLYRNAQSGECPLVIDKESAPSCGTSSSRFGCWTCTVVDKDRSMEGFIDAGFDQYEPLLQFRDWLGDFRDDKSKRLARRRNGLITYMPDGTLIPGPFTLEARQDILNRLFEIQKVVGEQLITDEEISLIKKIWAEDAVKGADFEMSAEEEAEWPKQE